MTEKQLAYFTSAGAATSKIHSYDWNLEKWTEETECPARNSVLAMIDGSLTTFGGVKGGNVTNKLYTLQQKKWVEKYHPMSTACSSSAIISECGCILIIGGHDGTRDICTVQCFRGGWSELAPLPQPLTRPSATICRGVLYVIGADTKGYACSLKPLLSSSPQSTPWHLWKSIPTLPVTESTAATLSGELVLTGGKEAKSNSLVNNIYQLCNGKWVEIGTMSTARTSCLVIMTSANTIVIVGGRAKAKALNVVEECFTIGSR